MLQSSTLRFLEELKKNNHKLWFDQHREKYVSAKNNFEEFITALLQKMVLFDEDLKDLAVKDCVFRINRDIRFSKNKTPYKISMSAAFNREGKKSVYAGYYFHLQPGGNSFVGGGLWKPGPGEIKKLRQEIDYCFPEFKGIISGRDFKKQYKELERDEQQMLVYVPKGYEKDHPAAEFLKMKSFVATRNLPDRLVLTPEVTGEVIQSFKVLMPLVKFINRSFE